MYKLYTTHEIRKHTPQKLSVIRYNTHTQPLKPQYNINTLCFGLHTQISCGHIRLVIHIQLGIQTWSKSDQDDT